MSETVQKLLKLYENGVIDDNALNKALNALQPPSAPKEQTASAPKEQTTSKEQAALEKLHARRVRKRQRRKQRDKDEEKVNSQVRVKRQRKKQRKKQHANVMNELKQVFKARESEPELKLVDKTKCGYLRAHEISARRYKDPQKLLTDKKSSLTKKIVNDMLELKGLKFQLALTVRFSKDKKETTGTFYSFQQGITNSNGISDSYNQASSHIENGIEKFTNNGSGWVIDRCETLYLNIAKYEPLKGSSYIPLPKELASKKAIINIKNTDNRCLVHAINSALNPATHHSDRLSSYPVPNFKFEGIDFPTPISQIP
ncbi:MAG: hypothetical protein KZQ70_15750, partial [gamma proteobacterium symbiont of Lucinoma myriamae]|nr:hypothetical protein [gamma proteobacterium symbiont of Lucinoma myriamae]